MPTTTSKTVRRVDAEPAVPAPQAKRPRRSRTNERGGSTALDAEALYEQAVAASRAGTKPGRGTTVEDAEVVAWIKAMRGSWPAITRGKCETISYRLMPWAVGQQRFNHCWEQAS